MTPLATDISPSAFPLVRLRYIGRLKGGAGFPDAEQGVVGEEYPFFKVKHLATAEADGRMRASEHSVSRETAERLGAFVFPEDSIVFAKVGAALMLNRFRFLGQPSCIDNNMMGLVIDTKRVLIRFGLHALSLVDLGLAANPGAVPSVNADQVGDQAIPVPPLDFQRAIANFLDRETARLDALVAEKERLLGLLAEKRRALITRAVTRGLNPDVALRDSGIPWLGEIPAHWETPPVYARFEVQLGKMLDEKKIRGARLASYLRNVDVQWGTINTSGLPEMDFDDDDRRRYSLRSGDILICEGGEVGRSAIWNGSHPECYYQKALHRLRPITGKDEPAFFVRVMRVIVGLGQFELQSSAATIRHLPAEQLRIIRYPAPPPHEQQAIVSYLSSSTQELDAVSTATQRTIDLLKERRSALIAAAVTGQIDVEQAA